MQKRWTKIAQATISLALLGYVFSLIPLYEINNALLSISLPLLVAGFLITLLSQYLTSVQMCMIMARQATALSSYRIFVVNLVTKFYSLFLPGTLAGGAVRWYQFKIAGVAAADALAAIVFNRIFETLLLVGSGLLFLAADTNRISASTSLIAIAILSLLLLTAFYSLFDPRFHALLLRVQQRLKLDGVWKRKLDKLLSSLARYNKLGISFQLKLLTIGVARQLIGIFSIYIFALAVDIDISFYTLAWVRSVFTLLVMLPISISGLGVRELTFISILTQYGVPPGSCLMLSLILFSRNLVFAIAGGLYELKRIFARKYSTQGA